MPKDLPTTEASEDSSYDKSKNTYYRKDYGDVLKPILNKIIETKKNRTIPAGALGLKSTSMYILVVHAWDWIIDKEDTPEKTYLMLRKSCMIQRRKEGITIALKGRRLITTIESIESTDEDTKQDLMVPWKQALIDFIETSKPGDVLDQKVRPMLTPDDINYITNLINPLEEFDFKYDEQGRKWFLVMRVEIISS